MGKKNNIIEINGRRYDARTGAVLSHNSPAYPSAQPVSRSVDGIAPRKHATANYTPPVKVSAAEKQIELDREQRLKLRTIQAARPVAAKAQKHAPKPAQTLVRSTVAKPTPSFKAKHKVQTPVAGLIAQPSNALAAKVAAHAVHPRRHQLAKTVPKSPVISRFTKQAIPSPLYSVPANTTAPTPTVAAPATQQISQQDIFQNAINNAINNATSHTEPAYQLPTKHRRAKKFAGVGAGILASSALIAIIATQNMTDIKLQVASAKAGISASLPAQRPAGFHTSQLDYSPGTVTIGFTSNSDSERAYTIIENTSSWDSETLRQNYVVTASSTYQTVQAAGNTIYLLGDGQATWVTGGVWYKIVSHGSLNNRQLINLATSM